MKNWRYLCAAALLAGSMTVGAGAVSIPDAAMTELQQKWSVQKDADHFYIDNDSYSLWAYPLVPEKNLYKVSICHDRGIVDLKTGKIVIPLEYSTVDILPNGKFLLTRSTENYTSEFFCADENGTVTPLEMPVSGQYMGMPSDKNIFIGVFAKRPLTDIIYYQTPTTVQYDIPVLVLLDTDMNILRDDIDGGCGTVSPPYYFNGFMPVQTGSTIWIGSVKGANGNGKYGLIDQNGKFVSKNDFDLIDWRDCRYIGERGSKRYLLDGQGGETLLPANIGEESSWAKAEIEASREHDLSLTSMYYPKLDIARLDFCNLAVKLYQKMKPDAELKSSSAFTDCNDANVRLAASLGIVTGYADGTFRPYKTITRQEAAAMLDRLYKVLGGTVQDGSEQAFSDDAQFGDWARDSIYAMREIGIMQGKENNHFCPNAGYTNEQAVVTIVRLYQAMIAKP